MPARKLLIGRRAIFRGKTRKPVSLTLTPRHHAKVTRGMKRLQLTRSDFLGLLIEQHADDVELPRKRRYRASLLPSARRDNASR